MGKFKTGQFYKHERCIDAFIQVWDVKFDEDGENAILEVAWCVQGTSKWWYCPVPRQRVKITPEHYPRWSEYTPLEKNS